MVVNATIVNLDIFCVMSCVLESVWWGYVPLPMRENNLVPNTTVLVSGTPI
jgi:hypothetical protein